MSLIDLSVTTSIVFTGALIMVSAVSMVVGGYDRGGGGIILAKVVCIAVESKYNPFYRS